MGSYGMLARRVVCTETPVMVQIQELLRGVKDAISLAQGVVYWQPPKPALEKVKELVWEPSISRYGADEGLPELREALIKKLRDENKLCKSSVMVTAGANQAFVNIVLALCDAGDSVVMFAPYYFNAYMSFQMTGVTDILVGPGDPKTLHPDADWLERTLRETKPTPKLVTVVNPGNPSGTYIPEPLLKKISDICKDAGCWLVVDNTYEYFMYDGLKHSCIEGNHIVNIFSFSKAYGMMGWRVGYIAFPSEVEGLAPQLLKIQDNIPICASIISQRLALHSMEVGSQWVTDQVKDLVKNRQLLVDALSPLGEGTVKVSSDTTTHSTTVVDNLKTRLMSATKEFKEVLTMRTENLKVHENRRQLFSATTSKEAANPFVRQRPLANRSTATSSNSPPPWANDTTNSAPLFQRKHEDAQSQPLLQQQNQQQQQMVPLQDSYMQSRAEALHNVESTIHELGNIFTQLATMVSQQGELAIRIDENMEDTLANVEGAQGQLMRYLNSISSNRWLMIKIFFVLIAFLMIFLFFVA